MLLIGVTNFSHIPAPTPTLAAVLLSAEVRIPHLPASLPPPSMPHPTSSADPTPPCLRHPSPTLAAVPFSAEAWSFAGWVTAMVALGEGVFPGVVYIIGSSLWTLEACYSLWCAKDVSERGGRGGLGGARLGR